jgi:steroid delta-isomerase-like uncharacterized protein
MAFDNAEVARRYLTEIWAGGRLDVVEELVATDIVLRFPGLTKPLVGIDNLRERAAKSAQNFSEQSNTIDEIIVAGDRVVVRNTWRGIHRGDFYGIKGTGRRLTCESVEILRIESGRVVENISQFDIYSLFMQIGCLPPPENLRGGSQAPHVSA